MMIEKLDKQESRYRHATQIAAEVVSLVAELWPAHPSRVYDGPASLYRPLPGEQIVFTKFGSYFESSEEVTDLLRRFVADVQAQNWGQILPLALPRAVDLSLNMQTHDGIFVRVTVLWEPAESRFVTLVHMAGTKQAESQTAPVPPIPIQSPIVIKERVIECRTRNGLCIYPEKRVCSSHGGCLGG